MQQVACNLTHTVPKAYTRFGRSAEFTLPSWLQSPSMYIRLLCVPRLIPAIAYRKSMPVLATPAFSG
jgi:hypothetical protein